MSHLHTHAAHSHGSTSIFRVNADHRPMQPNDSNANEDEICSGASKFSDLLQPDETHVSIPTKRNPLRVWWLEILSTAFSLSCVVVNIAVLSAIDRAPYETFRIQNVDITPNTFISIVSTLSKSSFLLNVAQCISQMKWDFFRQGAHRVVDLQRFDDASRGPLGSLNFV